MRRGENKPTRPLPPRSPLSVLDAALEAPPLSQCPGGPLPAAAEAPPVLSLRPTCYTNTQTKDAVSNSKYDAEDVDKEKKVFLVKKYLPGAKAHHRDEVVHAFCDTDTKQARRPQVATA
ncbi:hypothetical protein NDU88_003002 [Pleurodeles waltl]|uniref:Uncharacterized protein n=1 Tax=Pleurodeles waltl TaxID=8319 RepID=A0AAV7M397_PLEWA|nr:hypothetical protein NDU88_003002 [Pleurodeles waltl]